MFLPVGMALWPTDKQGPEGPEQEAENVTGKAEEKKASCCLAGLLWQCHKLEVLRDFCVGQVSFTCVSSVASHKHAALRPCCPRNRNTVVLSSNSTGWFL